MNQYDLRYSVYRNVPSLTAAYSSGPGSEEKTNAMLSRRPHVMDGGAADATIRAAVDALAEDKESDFGAGMEGGFPWGLLMPVLKFVGTTVGLPLLSKLGSHIGEAIGLRARRKIVGKGVYIPGELAGKGQEMMQNRSLPTALEYIPPTMMQGEGRLGETLSDIKDFVESNADKVVKVLKNINTPEDIIKNVVKLYKKNKNIKLAEL